MKRWVLFLLTVVMVYMLIECSKNVSNASASGYGDYMHDKAAMAKLIAGIKEKGGGNTLKIVENICFFSEGITFMRQDPKKPEKVDAFVFSNQRGWLDPMPVSFSGEGNFEKFTFDIDKVNLVGIPDLVQEVEKTAAAKGIKKAVIDEVDVMINAGKQQVYMMVSVRGEGRTATVEADAQAKMIAFELN